jgi:hypothetical protein
VAQHQIQSTSDPSGFFEKGGAAVQCGRKNILEGKNCQRGTRGRPFDPEVAARLTVPSVVKRVKMIVR